MAGETTNLPKVDLPKPPEISKTPQPDQIAIANTKRQSALSAMETVTPGVSDRADLEQLAKLDFGSDIKEPPTIGGEIISPTAIRVGEASAQPAEARGLLSAITRAYGKQEIPVADRQKNVQEIVDAALKAGMPKETIGAHLKSLGINTVAREQTAGNEAVGQGETKTTERRPQPLTQEEIAELKKSAHQKAREYDTEEQSAFLSHEANTPTTLQLERSKLGDEIGQKFRAHGIAKSRQLDSLLNLLDNGINTKKPFYTADLFRSDESEISGAVGAAGPYDTGGFIVLGEPRRASQAIGSNDIPKTGVAGVLVNREWYDAIPPLEKAHPNIKFIRADRMKEELQQWVKAVDKK